MPHRGGRGFTEGRTSTPPSLRDLPPLKLDPNPKARPWTTKRQLTPTHEEVDAVEVAKRQAHTRLVMGYAPANIDKRRV